MNLQEEFQKLDFPKSLVAGAVIAGLYWVLFFDSGAKFISQTSQQQMAYNQAQEKLVSIRAALEDQKKFEADLKEISQNMKDFQAFFAKELNQNDLQARISTLAEQNNILLNKMAKSEDREPEFPKYQEVAVDFEVEGAFHNVMEFISGITHLNNALDFSDMAFKSEVDGDYPIISLKTTLVVYGTKVTTENVADEDDDGV
jgi:Tfp pilus assembly protein PilO